MRFWVQIQQGVTTVATVSPANVNPSLQEREWLVSLIGEYILDKDS